MKKSSKKLTRELEKYNEVNLQSYLEVEDLDRQPWPGSDRIRLNGWIRRGCGWRNYARRGKQHQQDLQQDFQRDVGGLQSKLALEALGQLCSAPWRSRYPAIGILR